MRRPLVTLFTLVLLSGSLAPPEAEARGPSRRELRAKRKAARALYEEGNRKYDIGQFREALALFSKAYETLELPGFLFNIGQCHRMLGQCERANFFYRGYLRKQKAPRNIELVLRLVKGCEKQIAAERERAEAERQARLKQEAARRVVVVEKVVIKPPPPRDAFVPPPPRETPTPLIKRWWFWTALGVGAAVLATGLGVGLSARTDRVLPSGSLGTYDPWGVR